MPVLGKQASPSRRRVGWNVEHTAQRQAMPHVAGGPFLRGQVAVVLRDRGLVHGRAEVGRVGQSFSKRTGTGLYRTQNTRFYPPQNAAFAAPGRSRLYS